MNDLPLWTQPASAKRGQADALTHLGAATCQTVQNIMAVVADQHPEGFTWAMVREKLPDGIRQTLALKEYRNAAGGLMVRAGYVPVGFVPSPDPDARGRAIRVWKKLK